MAYLPFYITTTGASGNVILDDLGGRTFPNSLTNYDLGQEFQIDEIRYSRSLASAIYNDGWTVTNSYGTIITAEATLELTLLSLNAAQHAQSTDELPEGIINLFANTSNIQNILSTLSLDDIGDVSIATTALSPGDILTWTGAAWENIQISTTIGILDETDGGTGQSSYVIGDILYASAPNVLSKLAIGTNGQVLQISGGIPIWASVGGSGTVTSVALSLPSIFSVSGSPVTVSGTLSGTLVTQSANTIFAGPSSGGPATPTFRSLVALDIPLIPLSTGVTGTLLVGNGGTGVTTSTGTGNLVLSISPTLTTPILGTPTSITLTNATGLPLTTGVTGILPITNGGTNINTYTTGDILYASATDVLSKLAIGTNGQVLQISGGIPIWASAGAGSVTSVSGSGGTTGLTLTGGPITVSGTLTLGGTLAIANGGTGNTTAITSFNALSPLTTKGDLITRDSTNNIRVPVGTNGQVLIADSTQSAGVKWGTADQILGQTVRFLSANSANSNTVSNTTAETNFTSNGVSYVLSGNTANAGSLIRFLVYGKFSTKSGATGTLTIRLKIGSTVICSNIITPGSSIADAGFQFIGQMQFRTIGAAADVYSHLLCAFDGAGTSSNTTFVDSSNGTNAFDSTGNLTLQMSAQWSTANASNSITLEQATFEILN